MPQETAIKKELKRKGWSYRRAALKLGVHWVYLCNVANGVYTSRRLGLKILQLPPAPAQTKRIRRAK